MEQLNQFLICPKARRNSKHEQIVKERHTRSALDDLITNTVAISYVEVINIANQLFPRSSKRITAYQDMTEQELRQLTQYLKRDFTGIYYDWKKHKGIKIQI